MKRTLLCLGVAAVLVLSAAVPALAIGAPEVPEPGTLALLGVGVVGCLLARRIFKRK